MKGHIAQALNQHAQQAYTLGVDHYGVSKDGDQTDEHFN